MNFASTSGVGPLRTAWFKAGRDASCFAVPRPKPPHHNQQVAILGSGVMGIATALQLKEKFPDMTIDLYSDRRLEETTSYGSGGLWEPYQLAGTKDELVNDWGWRTFQHLAGICNSQSSGEAGVQLVTKFSLFSKGKRPRPPWHNIVYRFQEINSAELERMGFHHFHWGWGFDTLVADPSCYLPWLMGKARQAGGVNIVQRKLGSLMDLPNNAYSVIFNCTGLGSLAMLHDVSCYPIRGQVTRVRAPWVKHAYTFDDTHYIIPNVNCIVVGGTQQKGNFSEDVDADDTKAIFDTCLSYVPSLQGAEVLYDWAGLRPGRNGVRLEAEMMRLHGQDCVVIHNYGHGGSGITLHWGCVEDAIKLALPYLGP